jgi:hypothetical protein
VSPPYCCCSPARCATPGALRLPPQRSVQALLTGAGAALGLILCLRAARRQLLAVAVVLASLSPALPVVPGVVLPRESATPRQMACLLGAGAVTAPLGRPGRPYAAERAARAPPSRKKAPRRRHSSRFPGPAQPLSCAP